MGLDQTLYRICAETGEEVEVYYWRNNSIVQKIFNPTGEIDFKETLNPVSLKQNMLILHKAIDLVDEHITIGQDSYTDIQVLCVVISTCLTLIDFDKYHLMYEESG